MKKIFLSTVENRAQENVNLAAEVAWRVLLQFDHMCDHNRVDVLGDIFNFKFTTHGPVSYVSDRPFSSCVS